MKKIILTTVMSIFIALPVLAANYYYITVANNDDFFIINGEKFEAKTYCLGWEKDERVIFTDGSPVGACASATLYNIDREESCEVWCD